MAVPSASAVSVANFMAVSSASAVSVANFQVVSSASAVSVTMWSLTMEATAIALQKARLWSIFTFRGVLPWNIDPNPGWQVAKIFYFPQKLFHLWPQSGIVVGPKLTHFQADRQVVLHHRTVYLTDSFANFLYNTYIVNLNIYLVSNSQNISLSIVKFVFTLLRAAILFVIAASQNTRLSLANNARS